jgi:uncharacterized OB-fold protein
MTYAKPLPEPDPDSAPFWEGCHHHRLMLQRCGNCGRHRFPAQRLCPHCRSAEAEWVEASGQGKVFSWIVVRHPVPRDVYAQDVPYVVALVELAEGVRMPSNIIDCKPEDVVAGMPVSVTFKDVTPDITLPLFRPEARTA